MPSDTPFFLEHSTTSDNTAESFEETDNRSHILVYNQSIARKELLAFLSRREKHRPHLEKDSSDTPPSPLYLPQNMETFDSNELKLDNSSNMLSETQAHSPV